ncbi:hypothetical protein ABIA32_003944 [Streptacidiphilus sp. MAP12-20]|uniref:hypothetical protein n=1 Tax=Streptacidiphilus sp. MAP12-20 TaxID=3156299 RepID=UPI0035140663
MASTARGQTPLPRPRSGPGGKPSRAVREIQHPQSGTAQQDDTFGIDDRALVLLGKRGRLNTDRNERDSPHWASNLFEDERSGAVSQPVHDGSELIPRPEKTPAALKAALAVVAADRLPEMLEGQTRAMAEAIKSGGISPLQAFIAHWAAVVEIERRPDTSEAYHRSNYLANHSETIDECRQHATIVAELYRSAFAAVNG